jgi:phenylalanyl-tRNA synthetase alpha chain
MIEKIHKFIEEADAFSTQSLDELEIFRIKFLGKKTFPMNKKRTLDKR